MRPLEIGVLLAAILCVVLLWRGSRIWGRAGVGLLIIITLAQAVLEGWRWQLGPLLPFYVMGFWRVWRKTDGAGFRLAPLFIIFPLLSGLLLWALPVLNTPPLSGPFAIGIRHVELVDLDRLETRLDPSRPRRLMLSVWYPAQPGMVHRRSAYLPDFASLHSDYARRLGWPTLMVGYLGMGRAQAREGVPPLQDRFPLVLYSHGLDRNRFEAVTRMERLASEGYVVIAVDHPLGADFVRFPDGEVVRFLNQRRFDDTLDEIEAKRLARIDVWLGDLNLVLDSLGHDQLSFVPADTERVIAMGFSNGGSAAQLLAASDDRVVAAINLDGTPRGNITGIASSKPLLMMQSEEPTVSDDQLQRWGLTRDQFLAPMRRLQSRMRDIAQKSVVSVFHLKLTGAAHSNFTDAPLLSPLSYHLGIGGDLDSELAAANVDAVILDFLRLATDGETASTLLISTMQIDGMQSMN